MLVLVRKECAEQREASKRTQHRVELRETGETRAREKARGEGRGEGMSINFLNLVISKRRESEIS